jgi:hypothetical protein
MTKTEKSFEYFKAEFTALCLDWGGVDSPMDKIFDGDAAYRFTTNWGVVRAHITVPQYQIRHNFESIYMAFRGYHGPVPFPLEGDFNRFSYKWNINASIGGKFSWEELRQCQDAAVNSLCRRLASLKEQAGLIPSASIF